MAESAKWEHPKRGIRIEQPDTAILPPIKVVQQHNRNDTSSLHLTEEEAEDLYVALGTRLGHIPFSRVEWEYFSPHRNQWFPVAHADLDKFPLYMRRSRAVSVWTAVE